MRVLIAEDDKSMRMLLMETLRLLGVETIVETSNGHDALLAFRTQPFDLVITDWRMPSMNGLELVEHIRILNSTVPVVMCTVVDELNRELQAMASGVTAYLTKPCPISEMRQKLEQVLAEVCPSG